jgi:hypothetical protein
VSHRFDPTRVSIEWVPVYLTEGEVTYSPDDDADDLGSIPA